MVSPVHGHPVFVEEGRLKDQVPALFAHLVGAKAASLGLLAGTGERANADMLARFRKLVGWDAERAQGDITFGDGKNWVHVESDEISLRARPDGECRLWHRYLAILERGNPKKVVLVKLADNRVSGAGQGGGGAIKMVEWKEHGVRWLQGRGL